jgi:hypothetical protein
MKSLFPASLAFLALAPVSRSGPVEAAIVAAMKLSDQPNYSWVTNIDDDAQSYEIAGRTVVGGYTRVTMPPPPGLRPRMSREVRNPLDAIFADNVNCVIRTDDGWKRPDDLPMPPPDDADFDGLANVGQPAGLGMGGIGRMPSLPPPRPRPVDRSEDRGYSNQQLAINPPHLELGVIVSSHSELKVDGETVTGLLTEYGAALLLVHDGQKDLVPRQASGIFTLWIRNGMVVSYQVKLTGVLSVSTPYGRKNIEVHQTMNTAVKDVGTTVVDVPDEAKRKLGP